LYESLSPVRRRRHHLDAGQAIERLYADDIAAHLDQLARHFTAGNHADKGPQYTYRAEARLDNIFRFDRALGFYGQYARALGALRQRQARVSVEPTRPSYAQPRLTGREEEVVSLVAQGLTNRQIAEQLVISERTAEGHLERIRNKLGVQTRAQVAAWAARRTPVASPRVPRADV
jgi:DNA-binding CsgD family transcriptional regulator